jgi:NADH dehydrogenase FAD-containing subunit
MRPLDRTVVLVGAGHAHLHVITHAPRLRTLGARVIVIDPGEFWYSGLATGMLGGMYAPEEDRIDVCRLAARSGVEFIRDRVVGVHAGERRVILSSGSDLNYDLVSFNIGSETDLGHLVVAPQALDFHSTGAPPVWPAKPISNLARLREHFTERLARGQRKALVIGGGSTGCEIAANLVELADRQGASAEITLLSKSPRLLPDRPEGPSRSVTRALHERGVRVLSGTEAIRIAPREVRCADGSLHRADTVVLATGLRPPAILQRFGLSCSREGLQVQNTLRSVDDPRIFGAGDCIDFNGRSLPKIGVFGVRQAPVLLENLSAALAGETMSVYHPQRHWLTILNLGRGEGLAMRGRLWWRGRLALHLKDQLDRKFLGRYR